MDPVLTVFRNLGTARLGIIGGATVAVIGLFVWMLTHLTAPDFALLYGDLDVSDSARIIQHLEAGGVPYDLRQGGTAIYVPAGAVGPNRLSLADQGLPAGGSLGYEVFDRSDGLGTTSFMQNVNLVRALEGELARTIRSIDAVQSARVHLVLPRRELFSREREQPSASVVLQMRGTGRLGQSQVLAIQHLVASAVPGLTPDRISVVDGRGTLLAGGFEGQNQLTLLQDRNDQRRRELETRLARTIEDLIGKTVGPDRVRAEISVHMDFDQINTSEEIFDPDGQVVRSTQFIEESLSSADAAGPPPVGVATNLPDADLDLIDLGGRGTEETRSEETVNYEISKRVINHVRESGVIHRISAAVLVDGTYGPGADGPRTYQPRSAEELEILATLVRSAVGFDSRRGDTIEIVNLRFSEPEADLSDDLALFFGLERKDLLQMAQYLVLIVFALLVILLVVRPLLSRALDALPAPAPAGGPSHELLTRPPERPALAAPSSQTGPAGHAIARADERAPGSAGDLEEMIDLDRVEGQVRASTVRQVGELVDKHPEQAVAIIRKWLHEDD
ncbi:MAG: flagellar M-ring protein FliF [Rhodospirillales bacterium]|nr:MAG: flagellar M-ring protein FliF [Rhodospirillales bacterium]